jgi:high-affinity nickel-transport protein
VLTAALLGFALGLRHAFDPDHVVAVTAIGCRYRSPWTAAWVGASWGLGHSATIFAMGTLLIGLHVTVPAALTRFFELTVAAILVALGIANLASARRSPTDAAVPHPGRPRALHATLARSGLLGLAHGLAGSAAVALLALAAMQTSAAAIVYLVVFGVGTITGMLGASVFLCAPLAAFSRSQRGHRLVTAGTGLVSIVLGCFLLYQIGASVDRSALG